VPGKNPVARVYLDPDILGTSTAVVEGRLMERWRWRNGHRCEIPDVQRRISRNKQVAGRERRHPIGKGQDPTAHRASVGRSERLGDGVDTPRIKLIRTRLLDPVYRPALDGIGALVTHLQPA